MTPSAFLGLPFVHKTYITQNSSNVCNQSKGLHSGSEKEILYRQEPIIKIHIDLKAPVRIYQFIIDIRQDIGRKYFND